jgi:uncharacterized lipoprotein YmbA
MSLPDFRIQVHIEQFERGPDGVVRLVARWQISGTDVADAITTHKAELAGSGSVEEDDFDQVVAVMQELFGRLSGMIAATIKPAGDVAPRTRI